MRGTRPLRAALLALLLAAGGTAAFDLPDRPIGWLALPDDSLLALPVPAREGILRICAEMGWTEREYRLRAARATGRRAAGAPLRAAEKKALARLAIRAGRDEEGLSWIEEISGGGEHLRAAAALAELRLGRPGAAAAGLERAMKEGEFDPAVKDLLRFRLAGALRDGGDRARAAALYREGAEDREGRFRTASRLERVRLLFEEGEGGRAAEELRDAYGSSLAKLKDRDLLARVARHERGKGKIDRAAALWRRLLENWPADRRAREAHRALRALEKEGRIEPDERLPLLGARAAARSGRTGEALRTLEPLLALPEEEPLAREGALEAARILYGAGRFRESLRRALPLADGEGSVARQALLYVARCRKKSGEWRASVEAYRDYVRRYPESSIAPEAQWEIAWRLRLAGEPAEAATAFGELERLFPRSGYAARAPLYRALCLEETGRPEEAVRALEAMTGGGGGGKDREDALFWLADALARRGERERADRIYEELAAEFPETYYGIRAASRVGVRTVLPPPTGRRGDPLLRWIRSWNGTEEGAAPDTSRLLLYRDLGETGEARREADHLREAHRSDPEALLAVARACRRLGLHDRAIPCARRIQTLAERAEADSLLPELLALIYPLGHLDRVEEELRSYRVFGPFLVLALMRQESWFHEGAHSPAGARGLLQLMPATARRAAAALGEGEDFPAAALERPDRNIRYGLWYLQNLIDRYNGDLAVVASAYNAGEGMADLWRAGLAPRSPGGYAERVHFSETRNYVKRTLAGYWIYRYLYQNIASELYQ